MAEQHVPRMPADYVEPCQSGINPEQRAAQYVEAARQHHAGEEPYHPVLAPAPEQPADFIKYKKRPGRIVKLMQMIMSITFFTAILLAGFVMYSRYQVDRPGPLRKAVVFEVKKGQGLGAIAESLEDKGIIYDKRLFKINPATLRVAKKLKAGKFAIPERASMQQVLDILVRGRAIYYKVTVPEGLTSQQVVGILNKHPQLTGEITEIPPEGSLMPDTYQFDAGAKRSELLAKMSRMQTEFLNSKWQNRQPDLPVKTPREAVILASIVEKETGIEGERRRVAGVFVNRLRKGIKLQSDPTIIYGLVGGKGKLGHPLRRSELNKKTGYNTYHITGLPPTPIANPGRKAIEAVLNPARTRDLYFVADGSGGHAFASTLKEHKKNVRKWRKIEAERRAEQKRKEKEAEAQRLAALKSGKGKKEASIPGVSLKKSSIPDKSSGWNNDIPLPTRKPR